MKRKHITHIIILCLAFFSSKAQTTDTLKGYFVACETQTDVVLSYPATTGTWSLGNYPSYNSDANYFAEITSSAVVSGEFVAHVKCFKPGTVTLKFTKSTGDSVVRQFTIKPVAKIWGTKDFCRGDTIHVWSDSASGIWTTTNTVGSIEALDAYAAKVQAGTSCTSASSCNGGFQIKYTMPSYYQCSVNEARTSGSIVPLDAGAISGPSTVCVGATATFEIPSGYGTWTSSNTSVANISSTTSSDSWGTAYVHGNAAGVVTISFTPLNSASCQILKTLTVNTATAGTISGPSAICQGETATMTSTIDGGSWSSSNTSAATIGSTGVTVGVAGGSTTILYSATNSCGTATATTNVTVTSLPDPGAISGATSVCAGGTTTLADAVTGGVWSSAAPGVATVNSAGVVSGVAAGTATISYAVTNSCGTVATSIVVTVDVIDAGTIAGASFCAGNSAALTATAAGGVWSSGNTDVATTNASGVVAGIAAGTAVISYSVTNSSGCTATATAVVTVNALPTTISGTSGVIIAKTISLTDATTGGTWSSGTPSVATVGTSGIVTGVSAGSAQITYMLGTGCYTTKTVYVEVPYSIGLCEVSPLETCDSVLSYCDSFKIKVSKMVGAIAVDSFRWSPAIGATKVVSGLDVIYSFTAVPTTAVYTLLVRASARSFFVPASAG